MRLETYLHDDDTIAHRYGDNSTREHGEGWAVFLLDAWWAFGHLLIADDEGEAVRIIVEGVSSVHSQKLIKVTT